jgi:selenocysteine-specific elongation factor
VLTKADLAEPDWLELVREDVRTFLRGTFLEGAPILPVSAKTGEGLPALRETLATLASAVPTRGTDATFRLPIDRVFTIRGFGTVVTGTVAPASSPWTSGSRCIPTSSRPRCAASRPTAIPSRPRSPASAPR